MRKRLLTVFMALVIGVASAFTMVGCGSKTFTVTFDPDGGELVSGELVQVVESAADIVEPELKKDGYTLKGWDTVLSEIDSDTTVKALWEAKTYSITYKITQGKFEENSLQQITKFIKFGEQITIPQIILGDGEIKPYGWECIVEEKSYTIINGDIWDIDKDNCELIAKYDPIFKVVLNMTCTVRGVELISTLPAGTPMKYVFAEGDPISGLPTNVTPPGVDEYTFTAWKYRQGNVNTGELIAIDGKTADFENFEGFEDENGNCVITVYACCRANWTPSY